MSFVYYGNNGLDKKDMKMLVDLLNSSQQQDFLNKQYNWKWPRIQRYLKQVARFEELFLIAVYITLG
jgi:hypothetical protein